MAKGNVGPTIRLNHLDNVVVARVDIKAGTPIPEEGVTTRSDVPYGLKIAARDIRKGEEIRKYNAIIGFAATDIPAGELMHSHNIKFGNFERDYAFSHDYKPWDILPPEKRARFDGYVRENGRVGTRNYIGVIVLGNCGASVARKITEHFNSDNLPVSVAGVAPFIHELGCGMEMTGEPMNLLRRTLSGYVRNPNMFASLIVALGCERNHLDVFMKEEELRVTDRLRTLTMQELGGTRKSIEAGIAMVKEMAELGQDLKREPCSAEHIMIGLQCGGSDGFSGISANPALGRAMDILVRHGGTAILSETTEIFGVEHTLTSRAATPEIGRKLVDKIQWWLRYNEGKDCQINGRVSPGNNRGGLANVLEKSLGGVKKGGESPLMGVYSYAEPVSRRGLVFMDSPGYDPVSATGQIAGGANLVCFTTGRGSCFGAMPSPVIKIASNTPMFVRMEEDMDINCGQVIDGGKTLDEMGEEIFARMLAVASGGKSKSEALGVGRDEFVPWPLAALA